MKRPKTAPCHLMVERQYVPDEQPQVEALRRLLAVPRTKILYTDLHYDARYAEMLAQRKKLLAQRTMQQES